jgi:uncharacterized protein YjiS (DUF1127 family)
MSTNTAAGARASAGLTLAASAALAPTAVLQRWWATLRQHQRDRLTRQILEGLDDRTLRDIGIDRTEIVSVVKTRAWGRRWPRYEPF